MTYQIWWKSEKNFAIIYHTQNNPIEIHSGISCLKSLIVFIVYLKLLLLAVSYSVKN